jgi:hypothetical protein
MDTNGSVTPTVHSSPQFQKAGCDTAGTSSFFRVAFQGIRQPVTVRLDARPIGAARASMLRTLLLMVRLWPL